MEELFVKRNMDELGRLVIPKEFRDRLGWHCEREDVVLTLSLEPRRSAIVLRRAGGPVNQPDVTQRAVDELGRVVLPAHWLRRLYIAKKGCLRITVDDKMQGLLLTRDMPACVFCGSTSAKPFKSDAICAACAREALRLF